MGRQPNTNNGKHQAAEKADQDIRMDGPLHPRRVLRAEAVGDYHPRAQC